MKAKEAYDILEVAARALVDKCEALRAERDELQGQYDDLLLQVEQKIPEESRHETARRIIQQHEHQDNDAEQHVQPNSEI